MTGWGCGSEGDADEGVQVVAAIAFARFGIVVQGHVDAFREAGGDAARLEGAVRADEAAAQPGINALGRVGPADPASGMMATEPATKRLLKAS